MKANRFFSTCSNCGHRDEYGTCSELYEGYVYQCKKCKEYVEARDPEFLIHAKLFNENYRWSIL